MLHPPSISDERGVGLRLKLVMFINNFGRMEAFHKIQYYFDNNSQFNISLEPVQVHIADLVREAFSLKEVVFLYGKLDIMGEAFFEEKMQEVYESYSLSQQEPFCMRDFMVFWVKQDGKLRIDYKEYDTIRKTANPFLNQIYQSSLTTVIREQEREMLQEKHQQKAQIRIQQNPKSGAMKPEFLQEQTEQVAKPVEDASQPAGSQPKQPVFSTKRFFDDILAVKRRLKALFDVYSRKHYKNNTSLTFDEIPNQVRTFNLTVWMVFNRDFGFLKTLKKDEIHNLFKKYSERQLMGFELFEIALIQVLRRVFPQNKNQGWRVLSVNTEEEFHKKMKQLGIPYLETSLQEKYPIQVSSPGTRKILADRNLITKSTKSVAKTPTIVKASNMTPAARIQLQNPIPVENEAEDRIFMKEYRLHNRSKYTSNYEHKKVVDSPSTGLLKRLDDRIKKYANF